MLCAMHCINNILQENRITEAGRSGRRQSWDRYGGLADCFWLVVGVNHPSSWLPAMLLQLLATVKSVGETAHLDADPNSNS